MCGKKDIILFSSKKKNIPMLFLIKFVWHLHYSTKILSCKGMHQKILALRGEVWYNKEKAYKEA